MHKRRNIEVLDNLSYGEVNQYTYFQTFNMDTLYQYRGERRTIIWSMDSFLFIFFFFFTCIGIPIYVGYFVCDSASEFGAMGSTSFFGVFLP